MRRRPSASGRAGSWQGSGPNLHVPRMAAGYSAAAGMLAAGRDGAVACAAVVVPHAPSEQAVASSAMACLRFVRRKRLLEPNLPAPCWRFQASLIVGRGAAPAPATWETPVPRTTLPPHPPH